MTKRKAITVTRDDDGGLTLHDPASGLVLSVIATHPDANGPRGLFVECYAYAGGPVPWQNATRPPLTDEDPYASAHPTFAFYAREDSTDA